MYVCICKEVTERQIHRAVAEGARDLDHLQEWLGVSTGCGTCAEFAAECLQEALEQLSAPELLPSPA
ncbi:(2Fe-2S)-binding protein [Thiohalorhabdus sp. Cl-TMA]|uniref:Bacterioferritin-associated ferredoxin n=1 Tax=Thiohalorhabdus methylotrophus TaxID=3242694 RepID=A0ABV4TX71_9GAMM